MPPMTKSDEFPLHDLMAPAAPAATPRQVLGLLVGVALVAGMRDPATQNQVARVLSNCLTEFLFSFLAFYWYRLDSEARRYRRTRLLNTGVVAFAFAAMPYYLLRSRPRGERLGDVLRFLGFLVLLALAMAAGLLTHALPG